MKFRTSSKHLQSSLRLSSAGGISLHVHCVSWVTFMTCCCCTDPERLQPGVLPAALPGHSVDSGWPVSPRGCPGPVSAGPLLSLRSLQAGQVGRHGRGRSQSVLCHVVFLGCSPQQWHWGRYGNNTTKTGLKLLLNCRTLSYGDFVKFVETLMIIETQVKKVTVFRWVLCAICVGLQGKSSWFSSTCVLKGDTKRRPKMAWTLRNCANVSICRLLYGGVMNCFVTEVFFFPLIF